MSYVYHNTGHYSGALGFIEEATRVWFCADNIPDAQGDLGLEEAWGGGLEQILRLMLLFGPSQADSWVLAHAERTYASLVTLKDGLSCV